MGLRMASGVAATVRSQHSMNPDEKLVSLFKKSKWVAPRAMASLAAALQFAAKPLLGLRMYSANAKQWIDGGGGEGDPSSAIRTWNCLQLCASSNWRHSSVSSQLLYTGTMTCRRISPLCNIHLRGRKTEADRHKHKGR